MRVSLLFLLLLLAACSPGQAYDAALLLQDLAAGTGPSRLKETTAAPALAELTWEVQGRPQAGDLYRTREPRAALVLVPGAAREGKDDPRLKALAVSLARSDFLVLVPDLANLRALRVAPSDARAIADAVRGLAARPEALGLPLGIAAVSYAVGPAVLAALEPDVAERVGFILGIGGYHSSLSVARFFTTGAFKEPGEGAWRYREPNAYGRWVFVRANAERVEDPADRTSLMAIASRKLASLDAEIDDLLEGLGPEGRAITGLIENRDPERVPALVAALPEAIRADLEALSPARRELRHLRASLLLLHSRSDTIVPYPESMTLAAAVPRSELYLADDLGHVELKPGSLLDGFTLLRVGYSLLGLRRPR